MKVIYHQILINGQETNYSEVAVTPKLNDLIHFVCGHPHVPKGGGLIKVRFTRASLPDAESCFNTVKLPRHHQDYHSFRRAMNVAINYKTVKHPMFDS